MTRRPRILVVTVVHRPQDARIAYRQIPALLAAGWDVTYAAPFAAFDQPPPSGVRDIDLPRASGRARLRALRAARALLREEHEGHDVVLLHDPELLLMLPLSGIDRVVWDVHEDLAASLSDRDWVPGSLRRPLRPVVRLLERWAERRCATLLLAERSYAARFAGTHPVVPNLPLVPQERPPPPGPGRAVYVGRVSYQRGAQELVRLGEQLATEGITVELVGQADDDCVTLLSDADRRGVVRWHGFLPNDRALALVRGATAGLSLLHDEPNYRGSMPTKVVEYLAQGLPVVTTPLPEAVAIVAPHDLGTVVGFGDVDATAAAVRRLHEDATRRRDVGRRAWEHARDELDWRAAGRDFVDQLAAVAARP